MPGIAYSKVDGSSVIEFTLRKSADSLSFVKRWRENNFQAEIRHCLIVERVI